MAPAQSGETDPPAVRRPGFSALWLIWLALFGAIEGAAIADKRPGDTLTEHVRRWASIDRKSRGWRIRRFALLAFLAWLIAHFLSRDERGEPEF